MKNAEARDLLSEPLIDGKTFWELEPDLDWAEGPEAISESRRTIPSGNAGKGADMGIATARLQQLRTRCKTHNRAKGNR